MSSAAGDLWELISQNASKQSDFLSSSSSADSSSEKAPTFLFIGSKGAGKTTLIDFAFGEKQRKEEKFPTVGIDYRLVHPSSSSSSSSSASRPRRFKEEEDRRKRKDEQEEDEDEKDLYEPLIHLYEIGDFAAFSPTLNFLISKKNVENLSVFIVLDLENPFQILENLSFLLQKLHQRVREIEKEEEEKEEEERRRSGGLKERKSSSSSLSSRFSSLSADLFGPHEDLKSLDLFPFPVFFLLNKTDILSSASSSASSLLSDKEKKLLLSSLRAFAHSNGAFLLSTSEKDRENLSKWYRPLVREQMRKRRKKKAEEEKEKEEERKNKEKKRVPVVSSSLSSVFAMAGSDSFASIGLPAASSSSSTASLAEKWLQAYHQSISAKKAQQERTEKKSKLFSLSLAGEEEEEEEKIKKEQLVDLQLAKEPVLDSEIKKKEEEWRRKEKEILLRRKVNLVN